jgi:hypothetical protein
LDPSQSATHITKAGTAVAQFWPYLPMIAYRLKLALFRALSCPDFLGGCLV